jgi:hypothetical protein
MWIHTMTTLTLQAVFMRGGTPYFVAAVPGELLLQVAIEPTRRNENDRQ